MREEKKTISRNIITSDTKRVNIYLRKYLCALKGPSILRNAMRYAVLSGGKRLRPLLVMESCRASGGNTETALPFACAIELIHNFSLVHDDLPAMDNDDIRRGRPTCHKKFSEGLAILAGDALFNLAFQILSGIKSANTLKIIGLLSHAIGVENMVGGQALDLLRMESDTKGLLPDDRINRMKTAALISASCKIGALTASADTKDVEKLASFGTNLGLAFQVADDLEDSTYDAAILKKMKKKTRILINKARKSIASFGSKADALRYVAEGVIHKAARRTRNGKIY